MLLSNMLLDFVDREDELKGVNDIYESRGSDLFILYGRRRIGKTELIKKFIEDKSSFYFLAKKQNIELETERLRKEYSETQNVFIPEENNLENTIKSIVEKQEEDKFVFVIDEFPYWIEENKGILTDIQHLWDEYLKEENILLILMGSSVGAMETDILDYKSPLYGRRTSQLQLKELPIKSMEEFFPNYSFEDILKTYGAIGTIPYYLKEFDSNLSFIENIENTFLNKLNILYEEAEILLREELRKPNTYFNILKSILDGATTLNEISNQTKVSITNLNKYLKVLIRLKIIKKKYPITEPPKQTNFIYKLNDNYFRFWLKFVYPNQSRIEENPKTIQNKIKENYNQYMGPIFEEICQKIPKNYSKIGKWWYKENEIDIVALNEEKPEILLGECKWTNQKVGKKLLEKLKRKAEKVRWKNKERKEKYCLFSKSGFKDEIKEISVNKNNLELYSLNRIKKEI